MQGKSHLSQEMQSHHKAGTYMWAPYIHTINAIKCDVMKSLVNNLYQIENLTFMTQRAYIMFWSILT